MKIERPVLPSGREDTNLMTPAQSGLSAPQLDREGVRTWVAAHLSAKRPVEELGIEANRPADTKDFAFVGMAPKRTLQSDWYRCSFCQRDRQFSAGRIVLSSDRLLRLIGDDCWETHIDKARYVEERADWDAYRRRQEFEKIRKRVGPEAAAVATQIRKARQEHEAVLRFIQELPGAVREGAPLLYQRLQAAARIGGLLQVERSIKDYAKGGYILQFETVHRVSGLSAVLSQPPLFDDALKSAIRLLYEAVDIIRGTDWATIGNRKGERTINDLTACIRRALETVGTAHDAITEAVRFLSPENLAGVVRWRADKDCDLHLHDSALLDLVPGGLRYNAGFILQRPSALRPDLLPDTSELKRLLNLAG